MLRLSDPDAALHYQPGARCRKGDELASQIEQQMKKLEKQVKGSSLHARSGNTGGD